MFAPIRSSHADRTKMKTSNHTGAPTNTGSPSTGQSGWDGERASSVGRKSRAILTDSHFLIPLIVFCIGLAFLITLH